MMRLYYEKDIVFIEQYEKERTEHLIQAMGLEEKQFRYINYEIIKARVKPRRSIYALKCHAKKIFFHNEFVVDQTGLDYSSIVYNKVNYFLNLYAAVYDEKLCKSLAEIMSQYLLLSLQEKIAEIDYIIIPQGGNFLLGLGVGKQLHKPVIFILERERIYKDEFWDGDYNKDRVNNIIVLHDVLVTGACIYRSIRKLPSESYNLVGVYCMLKYEHKEFKATENLQANGIEAEKVKCLLEVNEDILKRIKEGSYEE